MSRNLLAGIVAVAAAALLAVAFLLGRASGAGNPSAPAPDIVAPAGPAPAVPGSRAAEPAPTPPAPFARPAEPLPATSAPTPSGAGDLAAPRPALPSPTPPLAGTARAADEPERAAVASYLEAVGRLQPGPSDGDPESLANGMAAALANGDTSSLDRMIRETEEARGRLVALRPPAPCAPHHRESLASLDDALGVLRSLKSAMESPEPAARLADVATQATSLRSRAEALQREEQTLRERYGLEAAPSAARR